MVRDESGFVASDEPWRERARFESRRVGGGAPLGCSDLRSGLFLEPNLASGVITGGLESRSGRSGECWRAGCGSDVT